MKKLFLLAILLFAARAHAQQIEVACPPGSFAVPFMTGRNSSTGGLRNNGCMTRGGDLIYQGISSEGAFNAKNYGALGDGRIPQDLVTAVASTTVTSASANFTPADVGKVIEIVGAAGGGNTLSTTIVSVQSSTSATMATAAAAAAAGNEGIIATDDTNALALWAATVSSYVTVNKLAILPTGIYYTRQTIRFVNPGNNGSCGAGASCGVSILGGGASNTIIRAATNGVFSWSVGGSSVAQGVLTLTGTAATWNFSQVRGIAIESDGVQYTNTVALSAGLFVSGSHNILRDIFVFRFHNPGATLPGLYSNGDFESTYQDMTLEQNDVNGIYINSGKLTLINVYHEAGSGFNAQFQGTMRQVKVIGSDFSNANGAVQFQVGGTFREFSFVACKFEVGQTGATAVTVENSVSDPIEFVNSDFYFTGGTTSSGLLVHSPAVVTVTGGQLQSGATGTPLTVSSGATAHLQGTLVSGAAISNSGTFSWNRAATLFVNLGTPPDGTANYCPTCTTATSPCTGSSTGAFAVRQNGAWKCL